MSLTKSRIILFLVPLLAAAATVPDRYIVELAGEPAAAYAVRLGHRAHSSDAMFAARADAIRQQHVQMRSALEAKGAQVLGETTAVTNTMFVTIPSARVADLSAIPGVVRVYPVLLYRPALDHALPLLKVPDAWNQIGGAGNAGAGIKVAVIDTGIDSKHPAFNNPSLSPPAGFPKSIKSSDLAFTNGKIIVAKSYSTNSGAITTSPAIDTIGHGTGVAMIVGGVSVSGTYGTISGIAPQAYLGNYKVFPDDMSGASTDSILAAINDAVNDGMDILTLSLGGIAPRPSDDILVQGVEAATAAGKIVTIAAGNVGSDPGTMSSPATAPDAISVGARPNDRLLAGSVQPDGASPIQALPGSGPNSPAPISGRLADVAQFDPSGMACNALPARSLTGSVALILRGVCLFETKVNNAQQAGAIAAIIYTDAARPDAILMDVGAATLPATMVSYADGAMLKQVADSGSVNVTVGFTLVPFSINNNRLSSFSSRGPDTGNGIKPDLIAIGEHVYTANAGSDYTVEDGTSFSAPMAAGAVALLEAARPGLTAQQYRSLLVNSATPLVQDSGALLTVQQQGSGFLNVLAAINTNIAAYPTSVSFGVGPATLDQTRTLTLTNVGAAPDTFSIAAQPMGNGPVPSLSANTVQLNPGQSQSISVELAGASLDPGGYQGYLQVQGTQNQVTAIVPYWYAVPSGVVSYVTVLDAPFNGPINSRQTIAVRPSDNQGLPVNNTPVVTVTSGTGRVLSIISADDSYPGVYAVSVRLAAGTNVFHITAGAVSTDVTITSP